MQRQVSRSTNRSHPYEDEGRASGASRASRTNGQTSRSNGLSPKQGTKVDVEAERTTLERNNFQKPKVEITLGSGTQQLDKGEVTARFVEVFGGSKQLPTVPPNNKQTATTAPGSPRKLGGLQSSNKSTPSSPKQGQTGNRSTPSSPKQGTTVVVGGSSSSSSKFAPGSTPGSPKGNKAAMSHGMMNRNAVGNRNNNIDNKDGGSIFGSLFGNKGTANTMGNNVQGQGHSGQQQQRQVASSSSSGQSPRSHQPKSPKAAQPKHGFKLPAHLGLKFEPHNDEGASDGEVDFIDGLNTIARKKRKHRDMQWRRPDDQEDPAAALGREPRHVGDMLLKDVVTRKTVVLEDDESPMQKPKLNDQNTLTRAREKARAKKVAEGPVPDRLDIDHMLEINRQPYQWACPNATGFIKNPPLKERPFTPKYGMGGKQPRKK